MEYEENKYYVRREIDNFYDEVKASLKKGSNAFEYSGAYNVLKSVRYDEHINKDDYARNQDAVCLNEYLETVMSTVRMVDFKFDSLSKFLYKKPQLAEYIKSKKIWATSNVEYFYQAYSKIKSYLASKTLTNDDYFEIANIIKSEFNVEDFVDSANGVLEEVYSEINFANNRDDVDYTPEYYDSEKQLDKVKKIMANGYQKTFDKQEVIEYTRNGLRVPQISLSDLRDYSYRDHQMDCSARSRNPEKKKFTDDEYAYQEFLNDVIQRMMHKSGINPKKEMIGMSPNAKKEFLENLVNVTLAKMTESININSLQQGYGSGSDLNFASLHFILRVNGYDTERTGNAKDVNFHDAHYRGIKKAEPIDERKFAEQFAENFKPQGNCDMGELNTYERQKGITKSKFDYLCALDKSKEKFKELIDGLSEKGRERQELLEQIFYFSFNYDAYLDIEEAISRGVSDFEELEDYSKYVRTMNKTKKFEEMLNELRFLKRGYNDDGDDVWDYTEEDFSTLVRELSVRLESIDTSILTKYHDKVAVNRYLKGKEQEKQKAQSQKSVETQVKNDNVNKKTTETENAVQNPVEEKKSVAKNAKNSSVSQKPAENKAQKPVASQKPAENKAQKPATPKKPARKTAKQKSEELAELKEDWFYNDWNEGFKRNPNLLSRFRETNQAIIKAESIIKDSSFSQEEKARAEIVLKKAVEAREAVLVESANEYAEKYLPAEERREREEQIRELSPAPKKQQKKAPQKVDENKAQKPVAPQKPAENKAQKPVAPQKPAENKAQKPVAPQKPAENKAQKPVALQKTVEQKKSDKKENDVKRIVSLRDGIKYILDMYTSDYDITQGDINEHKKEMKDMILYGLANTELARFREDAKTTDLDGTIDNYLKAKEKSKLRNQEKKGMDFIYGFNTFREGVTFILDAYAKDYELGDGDVEAYKADMKEMLIYGLTQTELKDFEESKEFLDNEVIDKTIENYMNARVLIKKDSDKEK